MASKFAGWSPYNYVLNNPVYLVDPDGRSPEICPNCITGLIGAGIGGLFGGGIEIASQLYNEGTVSDWNAVAGSTVQGAVTGGAAGFTGGASLATTAVVAGGANVVGGTVNRTIQGQETTSSDVLIDATVGAVFGVGGNKAAQLITKNKLMKELSSSGVKYAADDIVGIGKASSGKIIFMEQGGAKAGLQHILNNHGKEFVQAGISEKNITKFVMQAVLEGNKVGMQGTRPIFETTFKGTTHRVAVTVGNNGFVVGANMASKTKL